MTELISWGKSCNLKFNKEKTAVVDFSRRRKNPDLKMVMNNKTMEYSKTVKYRGVTLDRKLDWKTHIEEKIRKAKSHIYAISAITKDIHGQKPEYMKWAYEGIIRPALTYGALAWAHRVEKYRSQLHRLNRMAIYTMVNVPRSTPTRAL